jgi:hypothetical protein
LAVAEIKLDVILRHLGAIEFDALDAGKHGIAEPIFDGELDATFDVRQTSEGIELLEQKTGYHHIASSAPDKIHPGLKVDDPDFSSYGYQLFSTIEKKIGVWLYECII